ncbi:filamentous hemagglutinin N-terminal domain-containing protein, partial [Elioraea tepidiphila]|uniref:two-partner secretion domain-containing protein n=1 Tax=Elioraea tepidiphila TaxID=457934 RepID=UPI00138AF416
MESRPGTRPSHRSLLLAGAAAAALAAAPALAQAPQGGTVAHGSAAISATAAETRVHQSSNRAIIDWRSFDVGRDHRVAFDQPGAQAATLNRVHSGRESTIAGQITAPGTVIIQNTHGVVFSGTARVDVGNLVATSQTVDAARFAADGRITMRGGEAAGARVENQGTITVREAGLAALVGGRVANSGTIVARRGTVALASGETTTIDLAGDGVVQLAVSGDAGRADAGVENTGLIDAGGGRVVLSAGTASGLLSNAINTSGVIRAASADGAGGTIELVGRGEGTVRVAGNLDASGATRGGSVTVTGQHLQVASTARVTASGRDAGGSVRIGGDRQGTGTLRRAETATVEAGARIEARASVGTGGSVILWADRATRFDGAIDVTGPVSGGFAETSAVELVDIGDAASVAAGPGGQWLIDPVNITINAAMAAGIVGTLNGGGDVTVTTALPGSQPGNLTVASAIAWSGAGNLTLFADNDLAINNNVAITTSGAGSLEARALRDTTIGGPVTSSGSGNIAFDTGRTLTVNHNVVASGTGAVTLRAETGNLIASNAGNDRNVQITTQSGALRLEATRGSVLIRRTAAASTRNVRVQTDSGPLDIVGGVSIQVLGGSGTSWARVRSETGAMTLRAPDIRVVGGSGGNAFAEVVAGNGGSLTMEASRRILVQDGAPGSPGRVFALNGADLTMRAPEQVWNGQVRAGDPATGNGGEVTVAGAIIAGVSPIFNLAPGNDFTLEPSVAGPGAATTPSSYTSPVGLRVDTRGTGEITLNAPVVASQATLVSEERVTLAPGATVTGTGAGDAVVIAAGRGFDNQAGAGALAAPNGRWLLFLDTFDAMLGTEPTTAEFDLYNRPFDYADPARADIAGQVATLNVLAGNRIVYAEQPVITVTAETLSKTYGTAVTPGATTDASGLRPKDAPLANILVGGTAATSAGAQADATVGSYTTTPVASLTARGAVQGYGLVLVPGTLTVNPAPLTVTADDVARLYGAPNPAFTASFAGFVLGEG